MTATEWEEPVAAAIATKLGAITGIKSTAVLGTDNLPTLPGAIVLPPSLDVTKRFGNYETWEANYPLVIVCPILRTPSLTLAAMSSLASKVRVAWWTNVRLGLDSYVEDSYVKDLTPEIFDLAGDELPAYMGHVLVTVTESGLRTP
jgi:hypothetical protein